MRVCFIAALLFLPVTALGQENALPIETVHSDAVRPVFDVETVTVDSAWFPSGSNPRDYNFGVGKTEGMLGTEALFIRAKPKAETSGVGFGTLMQMVSSDPWLGKRIRLTARLKSEDASRVQLWLRVDGSSTPGGSGRDQQMLAFYNMGDRPIRGSRGWRRYEIVLDVSPQSWRIAFGFFLGEGQGQAWADGFTVETVGKNVPVSRFE